MASLFENLPPEEKLERLCSYVDIRQLVSKYAHFLDSKDMDSLVGLFVPDIYMGKNKDGSPRTGRDELKKDLLEKMSETDTTILKVATHVIEFQDSNNATGVVYTHGDIKMGSRWVIQAIRYDDVYKRLDSSWHFVGRNHQLWYSADVGENPLDYPPANWPEKNIGMGTLG